MYLNYAMLFLMGFCSSIDARLLKKRQHSFILTLDVNPYQGIEPTNMHASKPMSEYHFPIDSPILNITCTVMNPSYKSRLSITKQQKFENGESSVPIDILAQNEYTLSPKLDSNKYNIEFTQTSSDSYSIVLSIKNLKLEDNGIYTCKYNQIVKKINAIIYKPPTLSHLNFPVAKMERFALNSMASVGCRVTDVFPKPTLTISHPTKNLNDSILIKDISNTKHKEYYSYSISAVVNFTTDYTDNNKILNCTVQSFGSNEIELTKSYQLQVHGTQIIESECADNMIARKGEKNFEIKCQFFSNPREYVEWTVEKSNIVTTTATTTTIDDQAEFLNIDNSENESVESLVLREGDVHEHLTVLVDQATDGIYTAKLKFDKIQEDDFRSYKLQIGSLSHSIRLVSSDTDLAKSILSEQDTSIGSTSHSKFSFLLINLIFCFVFLRR